MVPSEEWKPLGAERGKGGPGAITEGEGTGAGHGVKIGCLASRKKGWARRASL